MKKFLKLCLLLVAFLGVVTSCTDDTPDDPNKDPNQQVEATVKSIAVDASTVPAEIILGQAEAEIAKIKLVVTMSDDTTKSVNVTKDMISAKDLEKLADIGTYKVTITYEGKTAEVTLVVVEEEEDNTLTDIALTVENTEVALNYGASFNVLDGIKAIGNDGISYLSKVTYTVTNKAGETVDKVNTQVENEVYTVTISIDFAGIKKSTTMTVTIGEKPDTSGNLIPNGQFVAANGAYNGWDSYIADGGAAELLSEEINGTSYAKYVMSACASTAYGNRLNNNADNYFTLYKGQAYQISFYAKASANKTIQCQVGQLVGGAPYFYNFGGQFFKFDLTTEMQLCTLTFIADNPAGGELSASSITFEMGMVDGDSTAATIWLGEVSVCEYSGEIEDTVAPVISASNKTVYIGEADVVDVNSLFTVSDNVDETVTPTIVIKNETGEVVESISGTVAGVYTVEVSATDAAGNEATATMKITVKEKPGTTKVDFAHADGAFAFAEEGPLAADTLGYWNDQNWVGSNVVINSATVANNEITIDYSSTGACDFGLQLFYKNSGLEADTEYTLKMTVNVQNAMAATINGVRYDLVAGDNEISVKYMNAGADATGDFVQIISSLDIQFVIAADLPANVIKLSNISWSVEGATKVDFAHADGAFAFGEEGPLAADTLGYWNDQNWVGSNVVINSATVANNEITIDYSSTGACDFGLQLFYKNSGLEADTEYTLKMTVNVQNAMVATINGVRYELVAGNNEISVKYMNAGADATGDFVQIISSLDIQFVIAADLSANVIKLSNISWDLAKETAPEEPDTPVTPEQPEEVTESEEFAVEDGLLEFVDEATMTKGQYGYWNDQNWCGSNVTVTSGTVSNNALNVVYTATGACDWGLQFFYMSPTLTAGQKYTLSLVITVENAVAAKVNDKVLNLAAGANEITVDYVEGSGVSSLDIQIVISEACLANNVTLSNIKWNLKNENTEETPSTPEGTQAINIDATQTRIEGAGLHIYLADKPALTIDDFTITVNSVETEQHVGIIDQILGTPFNKIHYIQEQGWVHGTIAAGAPAGSDVVIKITVSYTLNGVVYSKQLTFVDGVYQA